jgi:hypothetical protein
MYDIQWEPVSYAIEPRMDLASEKHPTKSWGRNGYVQNVGPISMKKIK